MVQRWRRLVHEGRPNTAVLQFQVDELIAKASAKALAEKAYQEMLIESGFEPDTDSNPEKFRRLIDADIAHWAPLVKSIGLRLD